MEKMIILQSGYLGFPNNEFVKGDPNNNQELLAAARLNSRLMNNESPFYYSPSAKELYNTFKANNKILKDFDFRERVLITAMRVFGTTDFYEWVINQKSSPYLTRIHKQFLTETLEFILGKKRNIAIESWYNILKPSTITEIDKTTPFLVERFFNPKEKNNYEEAVYRGSESLSTEYRPFLKTSVISNIQEWTSRENGFYDILSFMNVVFGEHLKPVNVK